MARPSIKPPSCKIFLFLGSWEVGSKGFTFTDQKDFQQYAINMNSCDTWCVERCPRQVFYCVEDTPTWVGAPGLHRTEWLNLGYDLELLCIEAVQYRGRGPVIHRYSNTRRVLMVVSLCE